MFLNKIFSKKKNDNTIFNKDFSEFNKNFSTSYTEEDRKNGITDPNILLGEGLKLSLTGDGIEPINRRNANILVVGGSGSGKQGGGSGSSGSGSSKSSASSSASKNARGSPERISSFLTLCIISDRSACLSYCACFERRKLIRF